jgi:hypothetical protein
MIYRPRSVSSFGVSRPSKELGVNFVTCGRDKPLEERFIGTMRARAKNGASGSCPVDVSQHECHYHQRDGKPQTDQNGEDIECLFAHRHARWQQEGFNRQDYDWGRNCFLRALPHTFAALRAAQCGPLSQGEEPRVTDHAKDAFS